MTRVIAAGFVVLFGCALLPSNPISVIESSLEIPKRCALVGPVEIGLSDPPSESNYPGIRSNPGRPPEALKPELLAWAKRVTRDWDGDMLVFRTIVEKRPVSALEPSLWCECEVYRCPAESSEDPTRVPLVALLASPESYEDQLVVVTAWAAVKHELAALFLNPDDKDHLAFEAAISLDGPESLFSDLPFPYCGYLEVEGRFSTRNSVPYFRGHLAVHRLAPRDPYESGVSDTRRLTRRCS